jgi:hypothetical protein
MKMVEIRARVDAAPELSPSGSAIWRASSRQPGTAVSHHDGDSPQHLHGDVVDCFLNVLPPPRRNEERVADRVVTDNRRAGRPHDNYIISHQRKGDRDIFRPHRIAETRRHRQNVAAIVPLHATSMLDAICETARRLSATSLRVNGEWGHPVWRTTRPLEAGMAGLAKTQAVAYSFSSISTGAEDFRGEDDGFQPCSLVR